MELYCINSMQQSLLFY